MSNKYIKYSEYLAGQVDKTINYSNYLSENLNTGLSYSEYDSNEEKRKNRIDKIDKILNESK